VVEVFVGSAVGNALGVIFFLFLLPIVTPVAISQVIKKVGFSGWWNVAPVSASVLYYATFFYIEAGAHDVPFSLGFFQTAQNLFDLLLLDLFLNWVLLVIFAFASWPSLSARSPQHTGLSPRTLGEPYGAVSARPVGGESLPSPLRLQAPGWYQVGQTNNDQAYWNGQTWTARRRWEGAGWNEMAIVPEPTS
jgi:hypothetical protein